MIPVVRFVNDFKSLRLSRRPADAEDEGEAADESYKFTMPVDDLYRIENVQQSIICMVEPRKS